MSTIPRVKAPDSTLSFLREGYEFAPNRFRRLGTDVFRARLMLKPVCIARGAEAAEVFYAPGRFTRKGAMPVTTVKMLQDFGSVQMLEGAAHAHRKRMFLDMLDDAGIARMVELTDTEWRAAAARLAGGRAALLAEAEDVLCRAILRWAGLEPSEAEAAARTRDYAAMIEAAGDYGVGAWVRGAVLRARNERWARDLIARVRDGRLAVAEDAPLRVLAEHRDAEGRQLDARVAAVELINLFRPAVAIAWFVVHAALALHQNGEWRDRLAEVEGGDGALDWFVQEVRRLAPFFVAIGGRVREPFDWRGERFAEGAWMVLDIFGTNRDPRSWDEPDAFRPERFEGWSGSPWSFVPQGGGPYLEGHRCPGERMTIALLAQAVRFLARSLEYRVPEQDLSVDLGRMPAVPASGFVIEVKGVRAGS